MIAHFNQDERFKAAKLVYEAALKAPFYADKYSGFSPNLTRSDWAKLPELTRTELLDNTYPRSQSMLTLPIERMLVTSTGGSSGVARYTIFTYDEWDKFVTMNAAGMRLNGIVPSDRVANLFLAGHLWPSFIGAHDTLRQLGSVHLPISGNIPPDKILKLCWEFDPTVMLSLPTLLVFLADLAQKEKVEFPSLRAIGYVGEQLSESAEAHIRRTLKPKEIFALAYSSADAGLMGYPCPACKSGVYHWPTAFQYLEVIDSETHEPCGPGLKGEVLVTNLARFSMPIIRYRLGDLAAFEPEPCPCGDPNPLFRLAGRAGEDFKIGGGFITMRIFEDAVAIYPEVLSLNFMLELEDFDNQMEIRLIVEAAEPEEAREVEPKLRAELFNRVRELKVGTDMGFIRNVEIRFVALGTLPRSPITGKVKRLNDKRFQAEPAASPQGAK